MFVARKLRESNVAEYLLYMWRTEDLLRAFGFDFDRFRREYLSQFSSLTEQQKEEQEKWYAELIDMMHRERVTAMGHLQICRNVIINLEELHERLMKSTKFPYYRQAYLSALPIIVELRQKNGQFGQPELETCFNALYGVMLLRLQQKPVTP